MFGQPCGVTTLALAAAPLERPVLTNDGYQAYTPFLHHVRSCCRNGHFRLRQRFGGYHRAQPNEEDSYVGWVRFVGEFVLYDDRSAFAGARKEHCVSGALPLDKQKQAAKRFDGKRVKITGTRVSWSQPNPLAVSLNHKRSPITNWCGGEYVLFATDMTIE